MPRPLLPALYLACSWCWCIGMFFPVLLVKDFGWPGFVVFAIPNCIGAMGVAFVLRNREEARTCLREHRTAVHLFSAATIVFHLLFLGWISILVFSDWLLSLGVAGAWIGPVGVAILALPAVWFSRRLWFGAAAACFVLSIACAALAWLTSDGGNAYSRPASVGVRTGSDLIGSAFPIAFGFLLCPLLDVSFLTLRRDLDETTSRRAFVLSFAIVFPALILFTLAYSGAFLDRAWLSYYIPLHMAIQSAFTIGIHAQSLLRRGEINLDATDQPGTSPPPGPAARRIGKAGIVLAIGAAGLVLAIGAAGLVLAALPFFSDLPFRRVYELVLSLYGLPFPAYVWIVLIPAIRRPINRRRAHFFWAGSTIAATPLLYMGAFQGIWYALPIAIAIPLLQPLIPGVIVPDDNPDRD